jgi:hypothetical protein
MRGGRGVGLALFVAAYAVACGNLVGIPDRYYEPGDDASSDGTTVPEGAGDDRGGTGDGPSAGDQAAADHVAGDVHSSSSSSSSGGDGSIGDAPVLQTDGACPFCNDSGLCVLACKQSHPGSLAIDSTHVFWANQGDPAAGFDGGSIMQVDKTGTNPTTLVGSLTMRPAGITAANGCVYWIEYGGGNVIRGYCSGNVTSFLSNSGAVSFAIAGTTMVWATGGGTSDSISRCTLPGCTASATLVTNRSGPFALDLDGTTNTLFWLENGGGNGAVLTCSLPSCTPSSVAATPAPALSLAIATSNVVVYTSGTVGQSDGEVGVWYLPIGLAQVEARNRPTPTGVATDGTSIYWVEQGSGNDGQVLGCDADFTAQCDPTLRSYASALEYPYAVAIDATRIYWVNGGAGASTGTVMSALR